MELNNMVEASNDSDAANKNAAGRWTSEEHSLFILGLQLHNKQWKNIADMVKTRTVVQIRTHAQKYFQKMEKSNPSGVAFPNGKSLSENGLYSESTVGDGEDGTRMPNYRSQSIGSADSTDSSKFGRSVSLGSDIGNDSDADKNSSLAPGAVPHCSSFPSDLLINSYMGGVELKPRSATMTDLKVGVAGAAPANGGPKKRSRDTLSSSKANTSMTSNPPKSPKRASSKHHQQQQAQMAHVSSAPNLPLMAAGYMMGPHGGHGMVHSASECDELDMISLLEKIDWNAIPSPQHRSPASSPFTDSAASLSSSSGHISYKSVLNKINSSPLQFSHIDHVNVNEELTDSDVFDVFDEYYRNVDLKTGAGHVNSRSSSSSSSTVGMIPITGSSDLKPELMLKPEYSTALVPVASPSFQQPTVVVETARKEPRVWFSSSVICELKTKTNPVQPGFSIGHGILKPWRERKPVSQLPPLRTLTSSTPPVVIPTQSLTLLDSTFCNYPPALYQNDTMMDLGGGGGYVSDSATLTSAESSNSGSAYCIGSGALSVDSPSFCSEDVLGSPKTFSSVGSTSQGLGMLSLGRPPEFSLSLGTAPQSPAVKKRGRPRKNSLTSGSGASASSSNGAASGTVKSRSCSNLSASNAPIIGGMAMQQQLPQTSVAPMTGSYLSSYPSFPALGTTASLAPPSLKETRARKNSLTSQSTGDLMLHHPYDDFMMSCREVDPTSSFAYQLSHEHDPVMPVSSHHSSMMMGGVGGVGMVGGSILGADPLFDPHFHGESHEMDCSFGFDDHELQTDANVVGDAVAAANLSKSVAAAAAAAAAVAASSVAAVSVPSEPVKTEDGDDFYDMLSAVLE